MFSALSTWTDVANSIWALSVRKTPLSSEKEPQNVSNSHWWITKVAKRTMEYFPIENPLGRIALGTGSAFVIGPALGLLAREIVHILDAHDLLFIPGQTIPRSIRNRGAAAALFVAICSPIIEEIMFRGWLQDFFSSKSSLSDQQNSMNWEKIRAILKTSMIFGLVHVKPSEGTFNVPRVVAATLMGACLGVLKEKTGDLWAPTALHATNNTLYVLNTLNKI